MNLHQGEKIPISTYVSSLVKPVAKPPSALSGPHDTLTVGRSNHEAWIRIVGGSDGDADHNAAYRIATITDANLVAHVNECLKVLGIDAQIAAKED